MFHGVSDVLYAGAYTSLEIEGNGRFAVAEAPTTEVKPAVYLAKGNIPVELRGFGRNTSARGNLLLRNGGREGRSCSRIADPLGYFRTHSSSAGEIDILDEVRTGDVVLVPYGYHGPAIAAPGYDLYFLNVMAGPEPERKWLLTDDPTHEWIKRTFDGQPVDPRLPYEAGEDQISL